MQHCKSVLVGLLVIAIAILLLVANIPGGRS